MPKAELNREDRGENGGSGLKAERNGASSRKNHYDSVSFTQQPISLF